MKQRYKIKIAGYEMNVVSDDTPEAIDEIVAELDRNVSTICESSRGFPRSEAIILCALDAMSEKRSLSARVQTLENELYGSGGEAERLRREVKLLKAYIERHGEPGPDLPDEDLTVPDGAAADASDNVGLVSGDPDNKDNAKETVKEKAKATRREETRASRRAVDPDQLSFDDMLRARLQSVVSGIPATDVVADADSTAGTTVDADTVDGTGKDE